MSITSIAELRESYRPPAPADAVEIDASEDEANRDRLY